MQRKLKPIFLRGVLGVALSATAIGAAATQAIGFEGDIRFEDGRLVLVDAIDRSSQCVLADAPELAPLARVKPRMRG